MVLSASALQLASAGHERQQQQLPPGACEQPRDERGLLAVAL